MKFNLYFWKIGRIVPLSILVFLTCFLASAQCVCTDCRCSDSLELVKLYNSTNGARWTVRDTLNTKSPWILTQPMTNWYGISLTNGRVTWIDLDGIADFNSAGSTGATGNGLRGQVPTLSFSKLTDLFLDVNQLTGSLPHMVLPKINVFSISFNPQLTGTIPTSWSFPTLQYLNMCHNGLDGTLPTLNFPQLVGLYLQNNKLKGALPTINAPLLADIRMSGNQFTGCFPASYRDFCSFNFAWFDNNVGLGDFTDFCRNSTGICQDTASCRYKDSISLVALYNAANGRNWRVKNRTFSNGFTIRSPWILTEPMEKWWGVTLNAQGCVNCLDLDGQIDANCTGDFASGVDSTGNFDLPDAFFNLSELELLYLNGNAFRTRTLPTGIGRLTKLRELQLINCQLANLPDALWTLSNLQGLVLNGNNLNQTLPSSVSGLRNIDRLHFSGCGLKGALPQSLNSLNTLRYLDMEFNQIDSFPSLSALPLSSPIPAYLSSRYNKLTFDDILPNRRFGTLGTHIYAPQDSVFTTTTLTGRVGDPLSIDLKIDASIADNSYKWFKNGAPFRTPTNSNKLIFNNLQATDAGVYTCEVTNSRAPLLTLYSRKITVVTIPNTSCRYQDSLQLVLLYNALGTGWTNRWDLTQPMTNWDGVKLNSQGCVNYLNLSNRVLTGSITTNLYALTNLDTLSLGGNPALQTWTLSPQIGNLIKLKELNLFGCNLTGSIPPQIGNLTNLIGVSFGVNKLSGVIPNEIGQLVNLDRIYFGSNPNLTGIIPTTVGNISTLRDFRAELCNLTGIIPTEFGNCGNLQLLYLNGNPSLTGKVPISLRRTNLNVLNIENDDIDSIPDLSNLPIRLDNTSPWGLRIGGNKVTFDDILSNRNFSSTATYIYAPQDSIFKDTTYNLTIGSNLTIDLGIDAALTTNKYVWIKNGIRVDSSNKNTLILRGVVPCDAGTYTVEVTNSAAPLLTLKSRIIKVVVSGSLPSRSFDTTICAGSSLRLLSGRVVVAAGNYADTLRNIRNCDSFIVNTRLIIAPAATTARLNPIICLGQNYTLPNNQIVSPTVTTTYRDTLKNKIGCDSVIRITTVNVNIPTVLPTQNPTICRGQNYTLPSGRIVSPLVTTVFNDTLRNQNGCDSLIRSTNLTVIQPKERPLPISICSGQKHTLPKNTVVSISGTYRDTFRSSVGCDSIIITTLIVNPPILFERNKTIFDGQKDTLPKGRVVNTEGVYRDSFKTKSGCDSIVVTTLTVKKIILDDICFEAMKKNITDAFTPNDDGVNDVFDPEKYFILSGCPYSLQAEQLMIVSRWGEVIFKAKPYEAWDGTSQNYKKPVAPGAYYYVLVFKFDGIEKIIRGVINCFSR